jgi:hypothetical protein
MSVPICDEPWLQVYGPWWGGGGGGGGFGPGGETPGVTEWQIPVSLFSGDLLGLIPGCGGGSVGLGFHCCGAKRPTGGRPMHRILASLALYKVLRRADHIQG